MAHSDPLPSPVLTEVASQVGSLLPSFVGPALLGKAPAALGESFSVWLLPLSAVGEAATGKNLRQLAEPTGRWHHQLRFGNSAAAFARSMPLGNDPQSWSVREVFESPLAALIDEAVAYVDANVKTDPVVRLLTIPAYYLHAFWLVGEAPEKDQVIVVDRPDAYSTLKLRQTYSASDFLKEMLTVQHVVGIM